MGLFREAGSIEDIMKRNVFGVGLALWSGAAFASGPVAVDGSSFGAAFAAGVLFVGLLFKNGES